MEKRGGNGEGSEKWGKNLKQESGNQRKENQSLERKKEEDLIPQQEPEIAFLAQKFHRFQRMIIRMRRRGGRSKKNSVIRTTISSLSGNPGRMKKPSGGREMGIGVINSEDWTLFSPLNNFSFLPLFATTNVIQTCLSLLSLLSLVHFLSPVKFELAPFFLFFLLNNGKEANCEKSK